MSRTYRTKPRKFLRHPQTARLARQTGYLQEAADLARDYGIELSCSSRYLNHKALPSVTDDKAPGYWEQTPKSLYED